MEQTVLHQTSQLQYTRIQRNWMNRKDFGLKNRTYISIACLVLIAELGVSYIHSHKNVNLVSPVAAATFSDPVQPIANENLPIRDIVLSMTKVEFGPDQVAGMEALLTHESGFNPQAVNRESGACGLFQALPCDKMDSMSIHDQIKFGFDYIKRRYGTPEKAWQWWQESHPIMVNGKLTYVGNWY